MLFTNTNLRTAMAYTNAVGDKVYPVIVDIKKGIKSTEEILFVSSDINTGILSVAFIQGNDTYSVAGAEVVCSIMRPDASTLDIPCTVIENNIVEVPLGVNGTSQDGIYSFDFKVFKGGNKVVGTPTMNYSVSLSISNDNAVLEDDRLPVLTVLMTQLTELKDEAREVINQANTATEATKVATANAIEATNNVNTVINTANQKMVEVDNAKNEMTSTVTNKVNEVEGRFNALTANQQQSSEVIDARDGETSLKARLDRDIEKAKQVYVNVEGNYISTDSSSGYLKDVEILGNTIQDASNLADIRSVGDTVEGQELYEIPVVSCGKNLFSLSEEEKSAVDTLYKLPIKDGVDYSFSSLDNAMYDLMKFKGDSHVGWYVSSHYNPTVDIKLDENHDNVRIRFKVDASFKRFQLEEGTQVTQYEPYQEDKLTILSPVQLEKVGDVRDRIICKDGVWGVEKNVGTFNDFLNCTLSVWGNQNTDTGIAFYIISDLHNQNVNAIVSNKFLHDDPAYNKNNFVGDSYRTYIFRGRVPKNSLSSENATGVKEYLHSIGAYVKYVVAQPTFIPLPHDQQIKLRTFANKTNISFLTEIEGMIKAQVPKSLGATVNTHTEQICSLNNELNRVKKLEESTVSTVTTESDFTTVEATSNGYFEDVKLEGKTLVNLVKVPRVTLTTTHQYQQLSNGRYFLIPQDTSKTYTIIILGSFEGTIYLKDSNANNVVNINKSATLYTPRLQGNTWFQLLSDTTVGRSYDFEVVILEGDHTQNPPSYFEGLKSVGQSASEDGADEIVVSSVKGDGNLLNSKYKEEYLTTKVTADISDGEYVWLGKGEYCVSQMAKGYVGERYVYALYDETGNMTLSSVVRTTQDEQLISAKLTINNSGLYKIVPSPHNGTSNTIWCKQFMINKGTTPKPYTPHQSDKKRLLYYNNETQAWEKPILREWDSIEKHADGKYYYHQRSAEVVLNGSEDWKLNTSSQTTQSFRCSCNVTMGQNLVCDRFMHEPISSSNGVEGILISKANTPNEFSIEILKTRLTEVNVQGFKQWLQANPTTVVYQLAEEKVYECTNIDLITYANETNYIVNSGAIVPRTTLKVHNNISNVVSLLQKKVSLLEDKFIQGLKQVLAGDMYSLAELLYPEDFEEVETENNIMLLPLE